jgi:hypothetical protein
MANIAARNAPNASSRSKVRNSSRRITLSAPVTTARRSRRKFLRYYPEAFRDEDYLELERGYKWAAHEQWIRSLGEDQFRQLKGAADYVEIARRAVAIEARTNLLFSFEKMALRDAVKSSAGAKAFATGLWDFLHGDPPLPRRFHQWVEVLADLPRRQTRVLTWPLATVFGFIAQPRLHFFLKPLVTRRAARNYGYDFHYQSRPEWTTYSGALAFARAVRDDIRDLRPRDMIDLQSFIWVQGSDEYPD